MHAMSFLCCIEVTRPLDPEEEAELKKTVPKEYHDLLNAFSPRAAATLPPHRPGVDMEIDLQEGQQLVLPRPDPTRP